MHYPTDDREIRTRKIAFLVACGSVLQIAESMIPNPVPGMRLGLANMLSLVALVDLGSSAAIQIAILRTILSSLVLGTFLSPTFIMSFSAGLASTVVMAVFYRLTMVAFMPKFSVVGISLAGALTHNLVQLALVYVLFIHHTGVFLMAPWLCLSSLVMGWITGLVAGEVCRQLRRKHPLAGAFLDIEAVFRPRTGYLAKKTFLHALRAEAKMIFLIAITAAVFLFNTTVVYSAVFLALLVIAAAAGVPFRPFLRDLGRFWSILVFSFVLPAAFAGFGKTLFTIGPLLITDEGVAAGTRFILRIVLLMFCSYLLVRTTTAEALAGGMGRFFSLFRGSAHSRKHMPAVIVLAWQLLPECWKSIFGLLKSRAFKVKEWRNFITDLAFVIVSIYKQAEAENPILGIERGS